LFIDVAVAAQPGTPHREFLALERGLPWGADDWTAQARLDGDFLVLSVAVPAPMRQTADDMRFFPDEQGLLDLPSLTVTATDEGYAIRARLNPARPSTPAVISGLLVGRDAWADSPLRRAATIRAPLAEAGGTNGG
jgi:hypothetical protein